MDRVLGPKTITLVGQNRTTADQLLAAMAQVYGLRIVRQDTAVVLTRPANPSVRDLSELGAAITAIIPRPLLQTFQMRFAMYRSEHNRERAFPNMVFQDAGFDLRNSLYRALRAVIEPKVAASKDRSLLLSDLKGAEKNLFGIELTADTFGELLQLSILPLRLFITDFDLTVLTGGFSRDDGGRNRFTLYLWHVDPVTGTRRQCAGFIDALIP